MQEKLSHFHCLKQWQTPSCSLPDSFNTGLEERTVDSKSALSPVQLASSPSADKICMHACCLIGMAFIIMHWSGHSIPSTPEHSSREGQVSGLSYRDPANCGIGPLLPGQGCLDQWDDHQDPVELEALPTALGMRRIAVQHVRNDPALGMCLLDVGLQKKPLSDARL